MHLLRQLLWYWLSWWLVYLCWQAFALPYKRRSFYFINLKILVIKNASSHEAFFIVFDMSVAA